MLEAPLLPLDIRNTFAHVLSTPSVAKQPYPQRLDLSEHQSDFQIPGLDGSSHVKSEVYRQEKGV